jgi:hypothetical protein
MFCLLFSAAFCFFFFFLLDDGKHAPTRGRRSASEECQPCKGNIYEAAAPHQGLLRYLQPQSYVSQFAIFIYIP